MPLSSTANLRREALGALKAALPRPLRGGLRALTQRRRRRFIRLEQLDAALAEVEAAFARSEDEARALLGRLELVPDVTLPDDPESPEYREAQLALYRRISGRAAYTLDNERSEVDVQAALVRPFPYVTGSAEVVGDQLIAQGFLLKALAGLPVPSRVVEFGPGWGHTTHHFLQLGHRVTAVEVDPGFAELLEARNRPFADRLRVVRSGMLEFRDDAPYDAAVFFESFHHCAEPVRMLEQLGRLVRPGGLLVLAGEPIFDMPYPWGVRTDGLSLWSMRRYGWLELGFETAWLLGTLRRLGWRVQRLRSHAISTMTDVLVARRS